MTLRENVAVFILDLTSGEGEENEVNQERKHMSNVYNNKNSDLDKKGVSWSDYR